MPLYGNESRPHGTTKTVKHNTRRISTMNKETQPVRHNVPEGMYSGGLMVYTFIFYFSTFFGCCAQQRVDENNVDVDQFFAHEPTIGVKTERVDERGVFEYPRAQTEESGG